MLVRLILICFVFCFSFIGCSVKKPSLSRVNQNIDKLNSLIVGLSPSVSKNEALDFSTSSINYSLKLSNEYQAISSPWLQNTLVNIGIKKRGLCYEWAEDLLKYLVNRHYETLEFHAVGANIGYMNEHNALSVSAKGMGIENSILLDAWRNSGDLYFQKIQEDKKYEWRERRGIYGILPR